MLRTGTKRRDEAALPREEADHLTRLCHTEFVFLPQDFTSSFISLSCHVNISAAALFDHRPRGKRNESVTAH